MALRFPIVISYYFECTDVRDRLYYCIPPNVLEEVVQNGLAKKEVLDDYPDGIDIKVSGSKFEEFEEMYSYELDVKPDAIMHAFDLIKSKFKDKLPPTGFISGDYLNELTLRIQEALSKGNIDFESDQVSKFGTFETRQQFVSYRKAQQDLISNTTNSMAVHFDLKVPFEQQTFTKLDMSDGEDPFNYLQRLKRKSK